MSDVQFNKAVHLVRNGPPMDTTDDVKLEFYKYFKQANAGDVVGTQPWAVQMEARAKWDAWNSVKGMTSEEAKAKYVEVLTKADPNWESNPALKDFK